MQDAITLTFLLFLSGCFSGSETALTAVTLARAESLVKDAERGSEALFTLKSVPSRMLITLLIANNLINIAASAYATVVATHYLGSSMGPGVAVGVLTFLILVFGEITPKSLAIRHSVRVSLFVAPWILFLMHLFRPLVWFFDLLTTLAHRLTHVKEAPTITESELMSLLKRGTREGVIEQDEAEMVERVFAFNDLRVADVMTSRHRVFALEEKTTVEEALPKIIHFGFSRIPIYCHEMNEVSRIVHWHDIAVVMEAGTIHTPLKELGHEPLFVPKNHLIDELFEILREKKSHLAIVVDEFGAFEGLVTMEDLLEELVGEIYDETDHIDEMPPGVQVIEEGFNVEGGVELRLLKESFKIDLRGRDSDSVSHWILNTTERIPRPGESFLIDGLTVKIEKASRRRIHQVKISRYSAAHEATAR